MEFNEEIVEHKRTKLDQSLNKALGYNPEKDKEPTE